MKQPIAHLADISKAFGDTIAVDSVSVDFFPGEILALVGANGSGKTTLMKVFCGNLRADSGEVSVRGSRASFASAADAMADGIRMLPQTTEIYSSLSVLENIFVGQEIAREFPIFRLMAWGKMRR